MALSIKNYIIYFNTLYSAIQLKEDFYALIIILGKEHAMMGAVNAIVRKPDGELNAYVITAKAENRLDINPL